MSTEPLLRLSKGNECLRNIMLTRIAVRKSGELEDGHTEVPFVVMFNGNIKSAEDTDFMQYVNRWINDEMEERFRHRNTHTSIAALEAHIRDYNPPSGFAQSLVEGILTDRFVEPPAAMYAIPVQTTFHQRQGRMTTTVVPPFLPYQPRPASDVKSE